MRAPYLCHVNAVGITTQTVSDYARYLSPLFPFGNLLIFSLTYRPSFPQLGAVTANWRAPWTSSTTLTARFWPIWQGTAWASAAEISQQIGEVSERTIRNRITLLLQSGRVQIGAIIYPGVVILSVQADVGIDVQPGRIDEVARQLEPLDAVMYLASTMGEYALIATLVRPTLIELQDYVEAEIGKIPGVRRVNLNLVTRVYKFFNYSNDLAQARVVAGLADPSAK